MSPARLIPYPHRSLLVGVAALTLGACADSVPTTPAVRTASASVVSVTSSAQAFHAERFTRERGAPVTVTRTISAAGFTGPFSIRVQNGDASGAHRVSSATVAVNGATVFGAEAFNQNVAMLEAPLDLGAELTLSVTVAGAPGGYLEIALLGQPGLLFCPGGPAGTYDNLRDAIVAAEPGATVYVCDGDFAIDTVLIDKPLTLRSLNSGMATLRDGDPNPVGQGGAFPALVIDGIASGTVRIADLNFVIGGSAVYAGGYWTGRTNGMWDRIEIDSVHIRGRTPGSTSSFVIRPFPSSVPTARMDVTNSVFEDVFIGVFALSGEVNVGSSRFDRTDRGVTYSFVFGANVPATGTTEGNVFHGCGAGGCIRLLGGGGIRVANNTIHTGASASPRQGGIVSFVNDVNLTTPRTDIVIEGNTIVGERNAAHPADVAEGWADRFGIRAHAQMRTDFVVRNNRIENVHTGLGFWSGNEETTNVAHDNVFVNGGEVLADDAPRGTRFTRNDATGFVRSFRGVNDPSANYRCNWWGSEAGPVMPAHVAPATYTPWATQPVAGTAYACDAGL